MQAQKNEDIIKLKPGQQMRSSLVQGTLLLPTHSIVRTNFALVFAVGMTQRPHERTPLDVERHLSIILRLIERAVSDSKVLPKKLRLHAMRVEKHQMRLGKHEIRLGKPSSEVLRSFCVLHEIVRQAYFPVQKPVLGRETVRETSVRSPDRLEPKEQEATELGDGDIQRLMTEATAGLQ